MKKMIAIVVALILCVSALSVAVFAAAPGSMAIVGENIPGVGAWDPADAAGDMEMISEYVYVKQIECTAGMAMNFKFAGNDTWDDSCNFGSATVVLGEVVEMDCGGGTGNMALTVDEECTLKFTVDLTAFVAGTGKATLLVEKVPETPEVPETSETPETPENPETGDMGIAAVMVAMLAAGTGLALVAKKKEI